MPITERDLRAHFGGRSNTYLERDMKRGRLAAERCRTAGGSTIQCIEAQFDAVFNASTRHSTFKARIADLMRRGPGDPDVVYRFRGLVNHPYTLDVAIVLVEQMRRTELNIREVAIRNLGRYSGPNARLMLLNELRLILRWIRRYAPEKYKALRDVVRGES